MRSQSLLKRRRCDDDEDISEFTDEDSIEPLDNDKVTKQFAKRVN